MIERNERSTTSTMTDPMKLVQSEITDAVKKQGSRARLADSMRPAEREMADATEAIQSKQTDEEQLMQRVEEGGMWMTLNRTVPH